MIKKLIGILLLIVLVFSAKAQIPLAYWDFESNTSRNTLVQTSPETRITSTFANFNRTITSPTLATVNVSNSGNGISYGGANAGFALSRRGFTTNSFSDYTDNHITFNSTFDCTGFSGLSISLDAMRADLNAPTNIDIWFSTDDVDYYLADYTSNAVSSSYSTLNFTLNDIADGANTLYIRIVGYNGTNATGVLRIDNLTFFANAWNDNSNLVLASSTTHGTGLSSGGTFVPTYGSFNIDINASNYVESTTNLILNGTLNIVNGNFRVSSPATSIIFHTADVPLARTNGTLTIVNTASVSFGSVGNTGGAAFAIPNSLFTATSFTSLTINRTNTLTLGNQSFVLSGNLGLTAGILNDNGNTITLSGNLTGTGTHTGTSSGGLIMNGSGATISGATVNNITLNNTGGFSLSGSPTITGTLSLADGAVAIGANTLTFRSGNIPITRGLGTLTTTTSSSLAFGTTGNTGGTAFIIPDNTFTAAPDINNFTVNRTNSLTLNNQNFTLRGILTLTSGLLILPSNHLFTLKSTSIANTALVAQVGGTIQYNVGSAFLVERFIPQLRRAYRDIAPAVNSGTGTFFTNWQESGVNNNGFGTHITGLAGTIGVNDATTGFDMTASGNRSLFTNSINLSTGAAAWITYTSTRGSNDTLSAYKGYRLTIRGNRVYDLSVDNTLMNANTILRSTGQLVTGNVTYNTSGVTGNGTTNTNIRLNFGSATGFTMIGNPYVSPIDWLTIAANTSNNNVEDTYWVFDPTVGTVGAYVTYNSLTGSSNPSSSNVNQYIQPGQAFFIRNNASLSPTFVIRESDKATSTSNLTSVFNTNRTAINSIHLSLEKRINTTFTLMDAAKFCLNEQFNNLRGSEDASKIANETENLSIINFGSQLSIDARKSFAATDSIVLRIRQTTNGANYNLNIDLSPFAVSGYNYFLRDRFTRTLTPLTGASNNTYNFTTTTDTSSFNDRFTIVANSVTTLPVQFLNIKAYNVDNSTNKVEWKVIQTNAAYYEIQHSNNGIQFSTIGIQKANASNGVATSYIFTHSNISLGKNYYRIRSVDMSDKSDLSAVVNVSNDSKQISAISIYPNPISIQNLNIRFSNIEKGKFTVNIFNQLGQQVYNTLISHNGVDGAYKIESIQNLSKGMYTLKIIGENYSKEEKLIVE